MATFTETLSALYGQPAASEKDFADYWHRLLDDAKSLYSGGWYIPPPNGVSVLTGPPEGDSRLTFDSLRSQTNWPSAAAIDWSNGTIFGYCSPVERESGRAGDFAVTLYFGNNGEVRKHFRETYRAVRAVLDLVDISTTSQQLYHSANAIFRRAGLRSLTRRSSDPMSYDIGHSLPRLPKGGTGADFGPAERKILDASRRFLDGVTDWPLFQESQVVVVAKLQSYVNRYLPCVSYQYIVNPITRTVFDEQDVILERFGLI